MARSFGPHPSLPPPSLRCYRHPHGYRNRYRLPPLQIRGHGLPILNLYERALSLLSCKFVDEVIIGAPWVITEDLIKSMNITTVVRGTVNDMVNMPAHETLGWPCNVDLAQRLMEEEIAVPKDKGILQVGVGWQGRGQWRSLCGRWR